MSRRTFSHWLHETPLWMRKRYRRQWNWLLVKFPVRYKDRADYD